MAKVAMRERTAAPAEQEPDSHAGKNVTGAAATRSPVRKAPQPRPFLDFTALMRHIDGDWDLLRQIVQVFADTCPAMLAELRGAIAANQPAKVRDTAHAIRGAARNFFAPTVESAAMVLEVMGSEECLSGASAALLELEAEVRRLQQALAALVQGPHR